MRKLLIVAMIALIGALPLTLPAGAQAQTPPASQTDASAVHHNRLAAVGAGAIIGIVLFNMLTYPLGSVPLVAAPLAPTPVDIALGSRVLATLTGGAGGLLAHYIYTANNN